MEIGKRLRKLRKAKNLSLLDVEKRTGLRRSNISRIEHGHSIPEVDTLEKYARALEIPLYRLLYTGSGSLQNLKLSIIKPAKDEWGSKREERRELRAFAKLLSRLDERQRQVLLKTALKMARKRGRSPGPP